MTSRTRTEIMEEVDELVEQVLEIEPEMSFEAARGLILESVPEIYDEWVAAPLGYPVEAVAKAMPEPTLAEVIHKAVQNRAGQLAWTRWPTTSLADLELETWESEPGRRLYDLYRSDQGRLPYSDAWQSVSKADAHADAWQTLWDWMS